MGLLLGHLFFHRGVIMAKEKEDLSKGEINQILNEFGAKDENDLVDIVNNTWNIMECRQCRHKFDIMKCSYRDGDPVCPRCHYS